MKCYRLRYISKFVGRDDTPVIIEESYLLSRDDAVRYRVRRYGEEMENMHLNHESSMIERFYPIDEITIHDTLPLQ